MGQVSVGPSAHTSLTPNTPGPAGRSRSCAGDRGGINRWREDRIHKVGEGSRRPAASGG
jgi:hypothetical protein